MQTAFDQTEMPQLYNVEIVAESGEVSYYYRVDLSTASGIITRQMLKRDSPPRSVNLVRL